MRFKILLYITASVLCTIAREAPAGIIYETDFTAKRDGSTLRAGSLIWNYPESWLGHQSAVVDPSGRGKLETSGNTFNPSTFLRYGALGTFAGRREDELSGPGFSTGDRLRLTVNYQFDLHENEFRRLAVFGVRECWRSCTPLIKSSPRTGIKFFYEPSDGGMLKLFSVGPRSRFTTSQNEYAILADSDAIGVDPTENDLESDELMVTFEMTYLGSDVWRTSELSLVNIETGQVLGDAKYKPLILNSTTTIDSSSDLYAAFHWGIDKFGYASSHYLRFEYFAAIPEPGSLLLMGVATSLYWAQHRRQRQQVHMVAK